MNAQLPEQRRAALWRTKIGIVPQFGRLVLRQPGGIRLMLRNQLRDALDPGNLRAA